MELDQLVQRLVSLNEQQRPTSALEVRQALILIKQKASDSTTGLDPAMASAPTQYNSPIPSTTPVQSSLNKVSPGSGQPPTVPVATPSAQNNRTPAVQMPVTTSTTNTAKIWTRGFSILFIGMLLLTVVGSIIAFNINQPYGSINPNAGLDHAVELGLSVILLLVAIVSLWFVHNGAAIIILLLTAMFTFGATFTFLIQTLTDIQQQHLPFTLNPAVLNYFSTSSLAGASLISFLWLVRPYFIVDRLVLLAIFGLAGICAWLQFSGTDTDIAKHIYLLILLILLIEGVLLAVQTERVRVRKA
jgi:hypothetical protein